MTEKDDNLISSDIQLRNQPNGTEDEKKKLSINTSLTNEILNDSKTDPLPHRRPSFGTSYSEESILTPPKKRVLKPHNTMPNLFGKEKSSPIQRIKEGVVKKRRRRRTSILKRGGFSFLKKTKNNVTFTSHNQVFFTPTNYLRGSVRSFYHYKNFLSYKSLIVSMVFISLLIGVSIVSVIPTFLPGAASSKCPTTNVDIRYVFYIHAGNYLYVLFIIFLYIVKNIVYNRYVRIVRVTRKKSLVRQLRDQQQKKKEKEKKSNDKDGSDSKNSQTDTQGPKKKKPILVNKNAEFRVRKIKDNEDDEIDDSVELDYSINGDVHFTKVTDEVKMRKKSRWKWSFKSVKDSIYLSKTKKKRGFTFLRKENISGMNDITFGKSDDDEKVLKQIETEEVALEGMKPSLSERTKFSCLHNVCTYWADIFLLLLWIIAHMVPWGMIIMAFYGISCLATQPLLYCLNVFFIMVDVAFQVFELSLVASQELPKICVN